MHRRAGRVRVALMAFLALAVLSVCAAPGGWLRETGFARGIFYPPTVPIGAELGEDTPGERFDHEAYGSILATAVDPGGWVNYGTLQRREAELDAYLSRLASAMDITRLSRHSQLALLLNAYNAFTLKLILDHPGIHSIRDIPSGKRWKAQRWNLAGRVVSLDELEHEWIRPEFGEPRVHYALVCAARSCPKLRGEPYTGDRLVSQLEDQARHFLARPANLDWTPQRSELRISEIFDWFRSDFGESEHDVVEAILPYLDPRVAREIQRQSDGLELGYVPYDWSLNGSWQGASGGGLSATPARSRVTHGVSST